MRLLLLLGVHHLAAKRRGDAPALCNLVKAALLCTLHESSADGKDQMPGAWLRMTKRKEYACVKP